MPQIHTTRLLAEIYAAAGNEAEAALNRGREASKAADLRETADAECSKVRHAIVSCNGRGTAFYNDFK